MSSTDHKQTNRLTNKYTGRQTCW